jgi:hypothetical protein
MENSVPTDLIVVLWKILAWKGVIQDLMEVGFDLGFMIGHLRQTAQCLFSKKISDEV